MRSRKDKFRPFIVVAFAMLMATRAWSAEAGAGPGGSGFTAHMAKIASLKRDSEELETAIKKLIAEKRETDDDAAVRSLTLEITEKYKALKELGDKLEEENTLVRFHYPEQAETMDRKYVQFKTKSITDLESEVGIDGRLDRIHTHVLATFPVPEIEKAKHEPPKINPIFLRKPASVDDDDVPEKIILRK